MPFLDDSVYNPPQTGWRVLVMRRWPRGVREDGVDEWFPDVAPSPSLLKAHQDSESTFDEFAERYEARMPARWSAIAELKQKESPHVDGEAASGPISEV